MKRSRFTTIMHVPRLKLGLTCNEYCLVDIIYHLSNKKRSAVKGWCYAKKQTLAEMMGVSKRSIITLIKKMEQQGLLTCSEDRKLVQTTELWETEVIEYNFEGEESSPGVKKVHPIGGEESSQEVKKVHPKGEESSPPTNIDSNRDNNIDNIIPPKVGKIETKIPGSWDIEVKRTVIQFLEYRQSLPAKDKIKTQQGWSGKINLFQKILDQHGPTILIKAINLSIEKEYKNVDPEWLFNQYPELRTNNLVKNSVEGISQPQAKKVLKQLWSNHKNLWKEKYTNKAKTNYVEALRMFYFDNPTLKPSTNGTTTP